MTGKQVFDRACAYLMEKAGVDRVFSENALPLINALISEVIPYQNSRNRASGKAEIESAAITSLDEQIALDAALCEVALPLGLASCFFRDELDNYNAEMFYSRYLSALNAAKKFSDAGITDIYGGDA